MAAKAPGLLQPQPFLGKGATVLFPGICGRILQHSLEASNWLLS